MANEDLAELVRGHWVNRSEVAAALEGRDAMVRIVDQFPPGTEVRLVECAPGARTVPEGRATGTAKAGKDTVVEFTRGVKVGHYYFAVGEIEEDGEKFLRSMKVRGKFHSDDEDPRPPKAFVSDEPADGPEPEEEPKERKASRSSSKGSRADRSDQKSPERERAERQGMKMTEPIKPARKK